MENDDVNLLEEKTSDAKKLEKCLYQNDDDCIVVTCSYFEGK